MINYNGMSTNAHLKSYRWSIKRSPLASLEDELKKLPNSPFEDEDNPFTRGWGKWLC